MPLIKEEQYLIRSALGQELLDHKHLFLSKRAAASFGHYADAQLRRLQNAIARDTLSLPSREQHILRSVQHTMEDFNRRHETDTENQASVFIDDAVTEGLQKAIVVLPAGIVTAGYMNEINKPEDQDNSEKEEKHGTEV